jgi:hypothetical protein
MGMCKGLQDAISFSCSGSSFVYHFEANNIVLLLSAPLTRPFPYFLLLRLPHFSALRRPTHSPGLGPVEWAFSHTDKYLQHHMPHITKENFEAALHAGLDSITGDDMKTYFQAAHYAVPGLPYRPYNGDQVL